MPSSLTGTLRPPMFPQRLRSNFHRSPMNPLPCNQVAVSFVLRGFYFLTFFGLGVYAPYLSIFLQSKGLGGAEVGTLWSLLPLGAVVAPPLSGIVADKFRNRRILVVGLTFMSGCFFAGLLIAEEFMAFAAVLFFFSAFRASTLPLVESTTLEHLAKAGQKGVAAYGEIRLWGGIGFIVASLLIGYLVDLFSIQAIVYVFLIGALFRMLLAVGLPPEGGSARQRLGPDIAALLGRTDFVAFLLAGFLLRMSHGPMWTFLPVHMQELGLSSWVIGWSFSIGVAAEVLFFVFSRRLLTRWSIRFLLMAAAGGAALRWWLYALAQEPWAFLIISLLHALTFAAFHLASVSFVDRNTPLTLKSSGQAFFSASTYGAGGIAGALLSGAFVEPLGIQGLLHTASIVALLSCAIYGIAIQRGDVGRPTG